MYGNLFKINSPLASNSNADLGDTLKTKKALNKMGFMQVPSYGIDEYPDEPMFSGIKKFQKAKGLQVDGVMKPGGETERTIAKTLAGTTKSILPRRKDKEEERRKKAEEHDKKFPWPDNRIPRDWPLPDGSYPKPKPKPKPGIPDIMLPYLGQAVGIGGKNKAQDVAAAKTLLQQAGFLSNPKTAESEADPDFKFDIQRFQTANGLKMDGVMNPGGETEKKLGEEQQKPAHSANSEGDNKDECNLLSGELRTDLATKQRIVAKIIGRAEEIVKWEEKISKGIELDPDFDYSNLTTAIGLLTTAASAVILGLAVAGTGGLILVGGLVFAVDSILSIPGIHDLINQSAIEKLDALNRTVKNEKEKLETIDRVISDKQLRQTQLNCPIRQ